MGELERLREIVAGVAALNPIVQYQDYTDMCCFCHAMKDPQWGGDGIGFIIFGDPRYVGPDHEPDCLWVRASDVVYPR